MDSVLASLSHVGLDVTGARCTDDCGVSSCFAVVVPSFPYSESVELCRMGSQSLESSGREEVYGRLASSWSSVPKVRISQEQERGRPRVFEDVRLRRYRS